MPRTGRPPVERITVACFACGEPIVKRRSDAERNISQRFFCNMECRNKIGARPRRREMRQCEWCEKEFYPKHDNDQTGHKQQFCSRECRSEWQKRNRVTSVCEHCGNSFVLKASQAYYVRQGRRAGRWCSKACESMGRVARPLDRLHNGRPVRLNTSGYVMIYEPDHPNAIGGGWVLEHRLVVERSIGRLLGRDEHVHHINGIKDDNRLENLEIMDGNDHARLSSHEYRASVAAMRDELERYRAQFGNL